MANTKVHLSSRIFLTFRGDTAGRWWVSKVAEGEFEIKVSEVVLQDTYFDYWIVQTDLPPEAQAPNSNTQIPNKTQTPSVNDQNGGDTPDTDAASESVATEPVIEPTTSEPTAEPVPEPIAEPAPEPIEPTIISTPESTTTADF